LLKKGVTITLEKNISKSSLLFLFNTLLCPYVIIALALQVAGYMLWIFVIARMRLGFAYAILGAFGYIFLASASCIFFNEKLTFIQWIGICLITTGVICMSLKNG
jgi:multidrug transporter EmrE-like cation transporter